jgi:hypothetical protein
MAMAMAVPSFPHYFPFLQLLLVLSDPATDWSCCGRYLIPIRYMIFHFTALKWETLDCA